MRSMAATPDFVRRLIVVSTKHSLRRINVMLFEKRRFGQMPRVKMLTDYDENPLQNFKIGFHDFYAKFDAKNAKFSLRGL